MRERTGRTAPWGRPLVECPLTHKMYARTIAEHLYVVIRERRGCRGQVRPVRCGSARERGPMAEAAGATAIRAQSMTS